VIPSPALAAGPAPTSADTPALSIIVLGASDGAFTENGLEVLTASPASLNRALHHAAGSLIAVAHGAESDTLFAQAAALDSNPDAAVAYDAAEPAAGLLEACLTGDWPALCAVTIRASLRTAVWPVPPAADPLRWILARAAAARQAIGVPSDAARTSRPDDPELRRRLLQELDLTGVELRALVAAVESLPAKAATAAESQRRDELVDAAVNAVESGDGLTAALRLVGARAYDSASAELADTLNTLAAGVLAVGATEPVAPVAPPPAIDPPAGHAKREHLLSLVRHRDLRVFVESGTYLGESVEFLRPHMDRIVTVEVEPKLHADADAKFAGDPAIDVRFGDALDLIPAIVRELDQPALIWLDGHFSGGVTGQGEFVEPAQAILEKFADAPPPAGSTVVIDDLRMFGREAAPWPTLEGLVHTARRAFPHAQIYPGLDSLVVLA
jgi:hypothetical protein